MGHRPDNPRMWEELDRGKAAQIEYAGGTKKARTIGSMALNEAAMWLFLNWSEERTKAQRPSLGPHPRPLGRSVPPPVETSNDYSTDLAMLPSGWFAGITLPQWQRSQRLAGTYNVRAGTHRTHAPQRDPIYALDPFDHTAGYPYGQTDYGGWSGVRWRQGFGPPK